MLPRRCLALGLLLPLYACGAGTSVAESGGDSGGGGDTVGAAPGVVSVCVLPGLDDPAPDRTGMGKIVEKPVAVTGANGPLQGKKLFGEPTQDFQRRLLVGQEHITPHGRVRGRDTGEVAKSRR